MGIRKLKTQSKIIIQKKGGSKMDAIWTNLHTTGSKRIDVLGQIYTKMEASSRCLECLTGG